MFGSVDALLTEIEERRSAILLQTYYKPQQDDYIKDLPIHSTHKTSVMVEIDFATDYTLIRQREMQQRSFSQHQATLFTIHLTIGQKQRNLAIHF